jgi:hypothetical protein
MRRWLAKLRKLFSKKSFIAGESVAGLLIALCALVVSAISLWQTRRANLEIAKLTADTVELNRQTLAFAEESEASKSEITLQVTISSSSPMTLSISAVSNEFVISNTSVAYTDASHELWSAIADPIQPGLHDLKPLYERMASMFTDYDNANTDANGDDWGGGSADGGYFPILVGVEYTFRGVSQFSSFMYELYYERWNSDAQKLLPNGYTALRKPRLVRRIADDEKDDNVLIDFFEKWRREHLPKDEAERRARQEKLVPWLFGVDPSPTTSPVP